MCGIAGFVDYNGRADAVDLLRQMIGLLHHRGPDASGIYIDGPAGLAHARLSIIDLSGGDQPICNEDKTMWIVFNGEIFNYPELRESLQKAGHCFYTRTDTEVLIHLYEEKGVDMFKDLNGQFAFAIWDQKQEQLLIARDRVGIRPLFYYQESGKIVFASEVKAIFADRNIQRKIDLSTLSDIFTCWVPTGSRSAFQDIQQLPPAHYAVLSKKGLRMHCYWGLDYGEEYPPDGEKTLADWTEELNALIVNAAKIRLRADVPVGAYLSGGIDSTYISAIVKKNFNNRLRTFSVGFADTKFDESHYQRIAIDALGTDHSEIICTDEDIGRIFPKIIWHTETPVIRTAPAPLFQLSQLVGENNYKVVLTGEGADELFAGYNIFKEDKVRRFWAKNRDSKMRPLLLKKLYPYIFSQNAKAQKFFMGFFCKHMEMIDSPVYSHLLRWQNTSQLKHFFSDDIRSAAEDLEVFISRVQGEFPSTFMRWSPLSRAQYIENKLFLSNYLLSSQGDRMAMAHSIEGRYPFLDHRVIEFAARVPSRFRMHGLNEKYILKAAASGIVPKVMIDRPKQPYRAPISNCFFGKPQPEYMSFLMSESALKDKGYFNSRKVGLLMDKCIKGKGSLLSERENMAVVAILSTQLLDHLFIRNFPAYPATESINMKMYP